MKHIHIAILFGIAALVAAAPGAQATCACICVDGNERTLCTDIAEASADQNMCVDRPMQQECPTPDGAVDPAINVPTPDGTEDCFNTRVWDPQEGAQGGYREIHVCGLAS